MLEYSANLPLLCIGRIVFAWLTFDAPIARGYGSITGMQSSTRAVRNAQKQHGLRDREIMVEITRVLGV